MAASSDGSQGSAAGGGTSPIIGWALSGASVAGFIALPGSPSAVGPSLAVFPPHALNTLGQATDESPCVDGSNSSFAFSGEESLVEVKKRDVVGVSPFLIRRCTVMWRSTAQNWIVLTLAVDFCCCCYCSAAPRRPFCVLINQVVRELLDVSTQQGSVHPTSQRTARSTSPQARGGFTFFTAALMSKDNGAGKGGSKGKGKGGKGFSSAPVRPVSTRPLSVFVCHISGARVLSSLLFPVPHSVRICLFQQTTNRGGGRQASNVDRDDTSSLPPPNSPVQLVRTFLCLLL